MKQIILPSTILEFTWLVIESSMEENGLVPSPKEEISSPQYRTVFEIHIHYFSVFFIYTGNFQVPPEKSYLHPKCQFLPKTSIWPKSLLYKPEKWLNIPPHEVTLDIWLYVFSCNRTLEAIILKHKGILKGAL